MRKLLLISPIVLLAAIIGVEGIAMSDTKGSKTCSDEAFAFLIGQPKEVVDEITTPEKLRVVSFDRPMTMDHMPDRLTVIYDADGIITDARCG